MHKNNSNLKSDETLGDFTSNYGKGAWQAPVLIQLAAQKTENKTFFQPGEASTVSGS